MGDLKRILEQDELHMVKVLIYEVKLSVRVGDETGEPFKTTIGTPQGECLSPTLFTLFLARALEEKGSGSRTLEEHNYSLSPHDQHRPTVQQKCSTERTDTTHNLRRKASQSDKAEKEIKKERMIDLQYADDITWVATNSKDSISQVKERIPSKLRERNLIINDSKISSGPDDNWQNVQVP